MTSTPSVRTDLRWALVIALGALALVRPVLNILGALDDVKPVGPLVVTVAITAVWIAVVVLARAPRPVHTLVLAGITYAVLALALSGILSPIVDDELRGPLANPIAILPMLVVNALWGLLAGLLAAALQGATGRESTT